MHKAPSLARLIALNCGLSPYAAPLVCDDMKGPQSLFGEIRRLPRCLSGWFDSCHGKVACPAERAEYLQSITMWEENSAVPAAADFSVAATTYVVGTCTSTFDVAWRLVERDFLPEWGGVLAAAQREGRGQVRRRWHSPRGNLYVSFLLPDHPLLQGDAAAVVAGYMLTAGFARLGFSLQLKWPNDLLTLEGKKVAGLLLEERNGLLVAGLGVNLAEIPSSGEMRADRATEAAILFPDDSSAQDEPLAPFPLWRELQHSCMELFAQWQHLPLADVLNSASRYMAWKGKTVVLHDGDAHPVSGVCLGFGPRGGVSLALPNGGTQEFLCGSLSLASPS